MPKRTWKRVSLALIAVAIAFAGFFAHHFAQDRSPVPQVAIEAVPEAGTASGSEMRHEQEAGEIVASRPTMLDSYAQLVDAANAGNAFAAFQLYQDALRCSHVQSRREVMEEYAAASGDETATEAIVAQLAEDQVLCAGMDEAKLALKNDWLVKAARFGHVEAQVVFFGVVTEHIVTPEDVVANAEELVAYKVEALRHLQSAARRGHDTALFNMALAYQQGTLADRDPVKAYAHMLALANRGSVASAASYLDDWARGMTAEELRQAELLSVQYGGNDG